MKKILLFMVLLVSAAVHAQTNADAFRAEVEKTIELQHSTDVFIEALKMQLQGLTGTGALETEKLQPLVEEIGQAVVPALIERMHEIYKENFTLDEMKQINAYLATPVGQKVVKLTPMLSAEGVNVVQRPEMQAKVTEIISKYLKK